MHLRRYSFKIDMGLDGTPPPAPATTESDQTVGETTEL